MFNLIICIIPPRKGNINNSMAGSKRLLMNVFGKGLCALYLHVAILDALGDSHHIK